MHCSWEVQLYCSLLHTIYSVLFYSKYYFFRKILTKRQFSDQNDKSWGGGGKNEIRTAVEIVGTETDAHYDHDEKCENKLGEKNGNEERPCSYEGMRSDRNHHFYSDIESDRFQGNWKWFPSNIFFKQNTVVAPLTLGDPISCNLRPLRFRPIWPS